MGGMLGGLVFVSFCGQCLCGLFGRDLPEQGDRADRFWVTAECLSARDRKIEAVEAQVSRTREFKQGLLQKMFV
jgi:hypothetical protein